MKVLVACEFSGTVRDAFIRKGHNAMSCDLLQTESPGPHYQGDVRDILNDGWDLVAHPPCTYLSVSGMHWTARGLRDPQLTENALEFVRLLLDAPIPRIALENPVSVISSRIKKPTQVIQPWWFGEDASKKTCLWLNNLPRLAPSEATIVPPKGYRRVVLACELPLCDCCEEPYCQKCDEHYGDCSCPGPHQDDIYEYRTIDGMEFAAPIGAAGKPIWGNQTASGQNKLGPSPDRWKIRSKTYQGVADAMAEQWGRL
jgi:hypothetical protein